MKFIIVRFAPGSSGKYISTLLQLSPDVNPWYSEARGSHVVQWFKTKFAGNFLNWLRQEPEVPYHTSFVSNRFPRGDEVGKQQALHLLNNDALFQQHWNNDKKICLISNKSFVPRWLTGDCVMVNVVIDPGLGRHWVDRCRLHKQFVKVEPDQWIIKQDHPDFCSPERAAVAAQFDNPKTFQGTRRQFLQKFIIDDPITNRFTDPQLITEHETNHSQTQIFVSLSHMLIPHTAVETLRTICNNLGIAAPDPTVTAELSSYYWQIHQNFLAERYRNDTCRN
jgi:hypothetical protein